MGTAAPVTSAAASDSLDSVNGSTLRDVQRAATARAHASLLQDPSCGYAHGLYDAADPGMDSA